MNLCIACLLTYYAHTNCIHCTGTMVEPTIEFGNQFLTILQQKLGVKYTERELNLVKSLYFKRKEHSNDKVKLSVLDQASEALNSLNPDDAERILNSI